MTIVGTYGYMPPEQFGERTVPASDLYSLGATLITLVTGTHPAELPQQDLRIQFEQAANLSPAFADWLRWMTEPSLNKRLTSAQEALEALENEQQRNSTVVGVSKPFGSRVSLTKNADSLEILTRSIRVGIYPQSSIITFLLIYWPVIVMSFFSTKYFSVMAIPVWTCILIILILTQFKRTRLHIDRQQISVTNEFLGFKWKRLRPARRQDISALNLSRRVKKLFGSTVAIQHVIIFWVGTKKIEIGSDGRLTEPEIDWLALELSDWLGMPITRNSFVE